jgi:hypothetical protein
MKHLYIKAIFDVTNALVYLQARYKLNRSQNVVIKSLSILIIAGLVILTMCIVFMHNDENTLNAIMHGTLP